MLTVSCTLVLVQPQWRLDFHLHPYLFIFYPGAREVPSTHQEASFLLLHLLHFYLHPFIDYGNDENQLRANTTSTKNSTCWPKSMLEKFRDGFFVPPPKMDPPSNQLQQHLTLSFTFAHDIFTDFFLPLFLMLLFRSKKNP